MAGNKPHTMRKSLSGLGSPKIITSSGFGPKFLRKGTHKKLRHSK